MLDLMVFQIMPQDIGRGGMCQVRHHLHLLKLGMDNFNFFIHRKHGGKPKGRAFFSRGTFLIVLKTNLPLHQMHQLFRDGQT